MSLDIFFLEGVADRLLALRQTNERLLTLAEGLGADPRDIGLIRAAVLGTLVDVGVSFGLHRSDVEGTPATILEGARFPVATRYTLDDAKGR